MASLKNYLSITKKEWNGLVMLLLLMLPVLAAPYIYRQWGKDTTINDTLIAAATLQLAQRPAFSLNTTAARTIKPVGLFRFNPNDLPVSQWLRLGLTERQITVIKHYEEKGGKFYSRQDVKKMYSLSAADYMMLEPYIDLPKTAAHTAKPRLTTPIELNNADSISLLSIYGIGATFAHRIMDYKRRTGGFINKEQLKDVFGVDAKKYIEINGQVSVKPIHVQKININTATFADLDHLPYLSHKQMNAIIQYRVQHGDYTSASDLAEIAILDTETIDKLKPYLQFK